MNERAWNSIKKYQERLHHFYATNPIRFQLDGFYVTNRADYWIGVVRKSAGYETDYRGLLNIIRRAARGVEVTLPQKYKNAGFF